MLICLHYTAGNASPSLFPAHKRKMTPPSPLLHPPHGGQNVKTEVRSVAKL